MKKILRQYNKLIYDMNMKVIFTIKLILLANILYSNDFGIEILSSDSNVRVTEIKQRKMFSNLYYHEHDGKQVIGYVCGGDEPQ